MTVSVLKDSQLTMARYLRDPQRQLAPAGVEPRRLQIYQDLVYNNIEGFISGGFPVLRSLYQDSDWHQLVRTFIEGHRCHTPYFLEISQEFLQFLMQDYSPRDCDPPFMVELAHYEWVELALDVSQEVLPAAVAVDDMLATVLQLSPLAWLLSYQFPVHRIGPGFRPAEVVEPTYLVVYRDREDTVRFMELNAATARLVEIIRDNSTATAVELLVELAGELGMAEESILAYGAEQLQQLIAQSVVLVTDHGNHA
ncbi:MAG: DUF2063 domain-containing protein [Gammaproteobacteria bacterium]|nr:MAG: DUF2063 domain-containing protein [Gammaproteobacteria bacterium]RLA57209.1 MAG: DUF2063 domain-containing protein [Gammaproteobacteria bacterium]